MKNGKKYKEEIISKYPDTNSCKYDNKGSVIGQRVLRISNNSTEHKGVRWAHGNKDTKKSTYAEICKDGKNI